MQGLGGICAHLRARKNGYGPYIGWYQKRPKMLFPLLETCLRGVQWGCNSYYLRMAAHLATQRTARKEIKKSVQ